MGRTERESSRAAFGTTVVIVTVRGSGAARPVTVAAVPALYSLAPAMLLMPPPYVQPTLEFSHRVRVNTTSSELNGVPSCQVTFGWRWKVHVLPSAEVSHDAARYGMIGP